MNSDRLAEELTCPITHELLRDPITLPCCGKAASREALKQATGNSQNCPMCRRPSVDEQFVIDAPCNRVVQALLDALSSGASQAFREQSGDATSVAEEDIPKLSASYSILLVPSTTETQEKIARLTLKVTNAANVGLRRVLCILVVDQSYSMYGSPWAQASLAMRHVVAMSREPHLRRHVTLRIITYNSRSYELDCSLSSSLETVNGRISTIKPGYGTSFRGAFAGTLGVMSKTVAEAKAAMEQDPSLNEGGVGLMPHNVSVVFMTDGQASESREGLAQELKTQILQFCHRVPNIQVTVHAVGFSNDCDKVLLQQIRDAGTHPGQFRYCEPGDSEDALCGRITGMFEAIAAHGGCDVTIERLLAPPRNDEEGQDTTPTWEFLDDDGCVMPTDKSGKVTVALRTKPDGVGTAVAWLSIRNAAEGNFPPQGQDAPSFVLPLAITCNANSVDSHVHAAKEADCDDGETVAAPTHQPDWTVAATENTSFAAVDSLKRAWVGVRLHVIAEDAISLLTEARAEMGVLAEAVRLEGAFLENRLRAVSTIGSDAHKRVPALLEQLQGLAAWGLPDGRASAVNLGRLRDLSSASAFSSSRAPIASTISNSPATGAQSNRQTKSQPAPQQATEDATVTEPLVCYSASGDGRNELQNALMEWGQSFGADGVARRILDGLDTDEQREALVEETDDLGNTAVHLAAYHGQFDAISVLLETCRYFDVDLPNNFGETPVTIAIKKRGYHKSVETLQTFGASIPPDRVEGLIRFSSRHDYSRTAAYLKQRQRDGMLGFSETKGWKLKSSADLPPLVFEQATSSIAVKSRLGIALRQDRPIDWASLVMVGLRLTQKELVEQGLEHVTATQIEPSWVFADCFPRKPDAPDTAQFLDLLKCILDFAPDLIGATHPETGETLLHRAVSAGSLPHVEFLVTRGISPDVQDLMGTTPLHISCSKKYPCIVDSFVTAGADINLPNNNGCTPISIAVQMGSLRIVETLVGSGAMLDGPLATNDSGSNLLHIAVQNNQPGILSLLLDRVGPETMLETDNDGFSPTLTAVAKDRKECLNILLDAAAGFMQFGIPGFVQENDTEDETASKLPVLEWRTPEASSVIPLATALHVAVHFGQTHALTTLLTRGANPNSVDGHGLTPLHRAAQRGDATAVYTLVAQGASCSVVDGSGRTPASYGRAHPSVMAALVGPVPGPLFAFAAGNMSEAAVSACSSVLERAKSVAAEPGLFSSVRILESPLDDLGQTALMVAASHGNGVAAQALVKAGSSPTREDQRGLSASAWAQMVKSNRLLGALGVRPLPLLPATQRLADACKQWGTSDSLTVFLGGKRDKSWPEPSVATSLHHRLVLLSEQFNEGTTDIPTIPSSIALLEGASRTGTVDRVTIESPGSQHQLLLDADRWVSKISAAGAVASGASTLRPKYVFAAHLATRHGPLIPKVNAFLSHATPPFVGRDKTLLDFAVALSDTLKELPRATEAVPEKKAAEEVYAIASPKLDREPLLEGKEITTSGFCSATTDWSVALAALSTCHGGDTAVFGSGDGVVLVISSKKASASRALWTLSTCPEDREIMFPPGSKFRVEAWFKGDIQVFGRQDDDRFKLKPDEIQRALRGSASLIIRLVEIV